MKNSAPWRLTVIAYLALAPVVLAGPVGWPPTSLRIWANPDGPDFQPYFLTDNGTRLEFLWPSGPLVIPVNEIAVDPFAARFVLQPPTIHPFPVDESVSPPASSSGGSSPNSHPSPEVIPPPVTPITLLYHPPMILQVTPPPSPAPPATTPAFRHITGTPPLTNPPTGPQIASEVIPVPEPGTGRTLFAGLLAAWAASATWRRSRS